MTRLGELTILALVCLCHQGAFANPTTPIDKVPTCEVPPVLIGETATLTCDFKEDVLVAFGRNVKVMFYGVNKTEGNAIVDCFVKNNENKYTCDVTSPYSLPDDVSLRIPRHMNLTFTADTSREGNYACLSGAATNLDKDCVFKLGIKVSTSKGEDTAADLGTGPIIGIVVGVLVLLAIIFGVVIVIKWRRANAGQTLPQFITDQICSCGCWSSAPTVKGSNEDNQPAQTDPFLDRTNTFDNSTGNFRMISHANDSGIVDTSSKTSPASSPMTSEQLKRIVLLMEQIKQGMKKSSEPARSSDELVDDFEIKNDLKLDKYKKNSPDSTPRVASERRPVSKPSAPPLTLTSPVTSPSPAAPSAAAVFPEKHFDWPRVDDLAAQKQWITSTLVPFVGCTTFPDTKEELQRQLLAIQEVQEAIDCRLEDLNRFDPQQLGACSTDLVQLKQAVVSRLDGAQELAKIRHQTMQSILKDLNKRDFRQRTACQQMDHVKEKSKLGGDDLQEDSEPTLTDTPRRSTTEPMTSKSIFDSSISTVADLAQNKFETYCDDKKPALRQISIDVD